MTPLACAACLHVQFSFDWSRGNRSGSNKREGPATPFLSAFGAYGESLPFTSRQRWRHFAVLLSLSAFMFVLAGAFLPLVLLRPQKFCLFFTLGSMLSMASFAVLRGPLEQLKHMFSLQRCAHHCRRMHRSSAAASSAASSSAAISQAAVATLSAARQPPVPPRRLHGRPDCTAALARATLCRTAAR